MDNDLGTNEDYSLQDESIPIEPKSTKKFERKINEDDIEDLSLDLNKEIEKTRSKLANRLLYLLIGTYIACFVTLGLAVFIPVKDNEDKSERYTYTKDIVTLLITTQTGLVGTALGFYFGSRNNK